MVFPICAFVRCKSSSTTAIMRIYSSHPTIFKAPRVRRNLNVVACTTNRAWFCFVRAARAHGVQESVRKFFRRRSGSPGPRRASIAAWVLVHAGTARASNLLPCGVNSSRRARWSSFGVAILTRRRRCSGFKAAVKVVRSIASNDATAPIVGASGRFKDIIRENWPFVRPSGRSALSKRRASARAARST